MLARSFIENQYKDFVYLHCLISDDCFIMMLIQLLVKSSTVMYLPDLSPHLKSWLRLGSSFIIGFNLGLLFFSEKRSREQTVFMIGSILMCLFAF